MAEEDVTDRADYTVTGGLTPVEGEKAAWHVSEDEGPVSVTASFGGKSITADSRIVGTLADIKVSVRAEEAGQRVAATPAVAANRLRLYHVDDADKLPDVSYGTVIAESSNWKELTANRVLYGTEGQVVTVVDVDSTSRKARGKGSATLPAPLLGALTVSAEARLNGQTVTVSPAPSGDDLRRYKITNADARPTVEWGTQCATADGWTDLPSNGEVSGAEGQVVTVVDLTNSGAYARAKGETTLPAPISGDLEWDADAGEYVNWADWAMARRDGRQYGVSFPKYSASNSPDGEKTMDNAGLADPVASTNETAGADPYQSIPLFATVDCNATIDADGVPHVTAIDGIDDRFTRTGADVYVMQMPFYWKYTETDTHRDIAISDTKLSGYVPFEGMLLPDGSERPVLLYAKYMASKGADDVPMSVSGKRPDSYFGSVANMYDKAGAKGAGYSGHSQADALYVQVMLIVKYATKNLQAALGGCSSYGNAETLAAAVANSNRVPLAKGKGGAYVPGSQVMVNANGDHGTAGVTGVRTITSIDTDDTAYDYVILDGDPFDADTSMKLATAPYDTGFCDQVKGRDGRTLAHAGRDRQPILLQGIEMMLGAMETDADAIVRNVKDSDTQAHSELWRCHDSQSINSNGEGYVKVGDYPATQKLDGSENFYLEDFELHEGVLLPIGRGATSTTGLTDAIWVNSGSSSSSNFANRRFGTLWINAYAGAFYASAYDTLGRTWWGYAGRLSALGRSKPQA